MGQFRLGEGDARDLVDIHGDRQPEQQMLDQEDGLVTGAWVNCDTPGDVADRIDRRLLVPKRLLTVMPCRLVLDTAGVEIEAIDIRLATDRDQKLGALDGLFGVARQHHLDALAQRAHALDLDAAADRDAFARQLVEHDGDAFRVFLRRAAAPQAPAP